MARYIIAIFLISILSGGKDMSLTLQSSAYNEGGMIPAKYTCDAANVSPPLEWSNVPEGTKSFALIFDDPDAPGKTWVHWVLFNIPADQRGLDEQVPAQKTLGNGAHHGINDFNNIAYGGPCPPSGIHRYLMKLYALDSMLNLKAGATKEEVLEAIKGHVIEKAELMGKYKRQ